MTDTAGTAIAMLAALGAAGPSGVAAAPGASPAHWQPAALLARRTAGLPPSAGAFQAGPPASSLPVMGTVGPAGGALPGTLLFGERLAESPAGIVVRLAGAAAAIAGIMLPGRHPGTAGVRNAAKQAGAAAGPQARPAASGRQAPPARRGRPGAGHRRTWAARW